MNEASQVVAFKKDAGDPPETGQPCRPRQEALPPCDHPTPRPLTELLGDMTDLDQHLLAVLRPTVSDTLTLAPTHYPALLAEAQTLLQRLAAYQGCQELALAACLLNEEVELMSLLDKQRRLPMGA